MKVDSSPLTSSAISSANYNRIHWRIHSCESLLGATRKRAIYNRKRSCSSEIDLTREGYTWQRRKSGKQYTNLTFRRDPIGDFLSSFRSFFFSFPLFFSSRYRILMRHNEKRAGVKSWEEILSIFRKRDVSGRTVGNFTPVNPPTVSLLFSSLSFFVYSIRVWTFVFEFIVGSQWVLTWPVPRRSIEQINEDRATLLSHAGAHV